MIVVQFNQRLMASIHNGSWTCDDKDFERLLNAMEFEHRSESMMGADPYPDKTSADRIAEMLHGEVTKNTDKPSKGPPEGTIN